MILDPQVLLRGKDSEGLQLFPAQVQRCDAVDQGEVLGAKGYSAAGQISFEPRGGCCIELRRFYGRQGPHEHHPIVVGRGYRELPAEKPGKLIYLDVGHALPPHQLPDGRIVGHARPLDRRQHQGLEPDGAVFPSEISEQRRHHPVGGGVIGLAGIPQDHGPRGQADEKPQARPLRRREEIPRPQKFYLRDHGEVIPGQLAEKTVPEDSSPVNNAVDFAVTAGHLAQDHSDRLGVGDIAGMVRGLDPGGMQIRQGLSHLHGPGRTCRDCCRD